MKIWAMKGSSRKIVSVGAVALFASLCIAFPDQRDFFFALVLRSIGDIGDSIADALGRLVPRLLPR